MAVGTGARPVSPAPCSGRSWPWFVRIPLLPPAEPASPFLPRLWTRSAAALPGARLTPIPLLQPRVRCCVRVPPQPGHRPCPPGEAVVSVILRRGPSAPQRLMTVQMSGGQSGQSGGGRRRGAGHAASEGLVSSGTAGPATNLLLSPANTPSTARPGHLVDAQRPGTGGSARH